MTKISKVNEVQTQTTQAPKQQSQTEVKEQTFNYQPTENDKNKGTQVEVSSKKNEPYPNPDERPQATGFLSQTTKNSNGFVQGMAMLADGILLPVEFLIDGISTAITGKTPKQ